MSSYVSFISIIISIIAISMTYRSQQLGNKQFAFDKRLKAFHQLKYIIDLKNDLNNVTEEINNTMDIVDEGIDNIDKEGDIILLKRSIDYCIASITKAHIFYENILFLECNDKNEYNENRIIFMSYIDTLLTTNDELEFIFDRKNINKLKEILNEYIQLLNSFNAFYYCYFNSRHQLSLLCHMKKIKEKNDNLRNNLDEHSINKLLLEIKKEIKIL